jgi:hypothetical protein
MSAKRTILVSGMIAADPFQGGATWAVLQYILGLRELGHEVYLIEPIASKTLRPAGGALADSKNARYFNQVVGDFDLASHSAMLISGAQHTCGLSYRQLEKIARHTDVLINISGMLTDQNLLKSIPIRVYLDLDPAFNQLWHCVEGVDMRFAGHTHFVTIGTDIGETGCSVPTCNLRWLKTLQPVVLHYWKPAGRPTYDAFTTVGNWRGYGSIEHQGVLYGQKAHSLRQFFDLPALTGENFVLALSIHPDETKDLAALAKNGWQLVDPSKLACSPAAYQKFIQESKGEFGIAKAGYAVSRCGWFSDRSACYLASGRPVIAQETGFSRHLPTGKGLFAFSRREDVVHATQEVRADYPKHAARARAIAEEYFDSAKVLPRLLEQIGA